MRRRIAANDSGDPLLPGARLELGWLVEQLRAGYYLGRLKVGDRLPGVRDLARRLKASPTTVHRWYGRLQDEGYIEGRERSGTFLRTVGVEVEPGDAGRTLYELVATAARKLQQHHVSPLAFCEALLRYSGVKPRQEFRFAVLCCQETYELLQEDVCRRLGFRLPFVHLSPEPDSAASVRTQLARDGSIRCLLTTFLNSPQATSLAREFALSMIMIRLNPASARVFEPTTSGIRGLVTRDSACAEAFRRVLATMPAPPGTKPVLVAAIDEAERLAELRRDANDVYVSPLCFDRARAALGKGHTVHRMPAGVSDETINEILLRYVVSDGERPTRGGLSGSAGRPAAQPMAARSSRM